MIHHSFLPMQYLKMHLRSASNFLSQENGKVEGKRKIDGKEKHFIKQVWLHLCDILSSLVWLIAGRLKGLLLFLFLMLYEGFLQKIDCIGVKEIKNYFNILLHLCCSKRVIELIHNLYQKEYQSKIFSNLKLLKRCYDIHLKYGICCKILQCPLFAEQSTITREIGEIWN